MIKNFGYETGTASVALEIDGYYVWDCSVIKAEGKYYLFASRWKEELGFGWNWLFNSEVIQCVAERPEGPYRYLRTALPRRGRAYFDGMNTHNPCIKYWNGKYYLYYMGTTYGGYVPDAVTPASDAYGNETWNRKRIGVAVAESIEGEFVRKDVPLLSPRDCSHWDCTITTNPAVAIMPNGKTYMIYKSRRAAGEPLQLGVAAADIPDGEFTRLAENPVLEYTDKNKHMEDPYLWYDEKRRVFCIIAKDDSKNGDCGITGEWGAGFYAESQDCITFETGAEPKVYSKALLWESGRRTVQCNLERPSLLFENGEPSYLFCASGNGSSPYSFEGKTYIVAVKLQKKG